MSKEDVFNAYGQWSDAKTPSGRSGWSGKAYQRFNFKRAIDAVQRRFPLDGLRIFDFGCGYGELLDELNASGVKGFSYVGVDILPDRIEYARKKRGDHFKVMDALSQEQEPCDVTFGLGVLAFHTADEQKGIIERMWKASERGFVINHWWDVRPDADHYEASSDVQRFITDFCNSRAKHHEIITHNQRGMNACIFASKS